MNDQQQMSPFTQAEFAKIQSILRQQGVSTARLAQIDPRPIVYAFAWRQQGGSGGSVERETTIRVQNSEHSIVEGLSASAQGVEWDIGGTFTQDRDISVFCQARNPLDYILMRVQDTANTKLSTDFAPLSHWVRQFERGWRANPITYFPGGNYSSYELVLRYPEDMFVRELNLSFAALQLSGLQ